MLYDMQSGERITKQPYPENMKLVSDRIPPEELDAVYDALNDMIEGTEIQTSSWMPGNDWTDTPFDPIYSKAARKDPELAAKLFGLIVWDVFQKRDEEWFSGRFELNGEPISGRVYFRSQG